MGDQYWYALSETKTATSPALLVYPKRIQYNAALMLQIAEDPDRLRPHIKTHKMAEIIQLQLQLGIQKYKCATLAEAELLALSGAPDVLLAMQPVSIHLEHFIHLIENYPKTKFSTLVDNQDSLIDFKKAAYDSNLILDLWLDINNGMDRTGIKPGKEAENLYKSVSKAPLLRLRGLHVYDGHIHTADFREREIECDADFKPIIQLKEALESAGYPVPKIIAGGTPTFPIHKKRKDVELSPGTPLLWDEGYGSQYSDLEFLPAAVLLTRIISKPGKNLLCFDLGHKSVASEMKLPRVKFLGNHDFEHISQSEEHLVVKCIQSDSYHIGDTHYALPIHICPTVSKYPKVLTVENKKITGSWMVSARDH